MSFANESILWASSFRWVLTLIPEVLGLFWKWIQEKQIMWLFHWTFSHTINDIQLKHDVINVNVSGACGEVIHLVISSGLIKYLIRGDTRVSVSPNEGKNKWYGPPVMRGSICTRLSITAVCVLWWRVLWMLHFQPLSFNFNYNFLPLKSLTTTLKGAKVSACYYLCLT